MSEVGRRRTEVTDQKSASKAERTPEPGFAYAHTLDYKHLPSPKPRRRLDSGLGNRAAAITCTRRLRFPDKIWAET